MTKTITEIKAGRIVREGTSPKTGVKMAVVRFQDGTEGALPREMVRSYAVAAAKASRSELEAAGFQEDGGAMAGLFSSSWYQHKDGRRASVELAQFGRIIYR